MSHIHPKWQLCLRLNLWKNRICWGRAGVHLPAISAKQESLGRYEHCTSARTIPPRIQKKWLTKKTSVYAVWSVTGKIIVLAMYKSTFQGKIADLGMVLDSVRVSGWIRWEILALVVRQLVRKSLCFLSLLPSLCSSCSTFALFFAFQQVVAKIEDFCAAVQHSGCLAILWLVFCSTLPCFTVFTIAQHSSLQRVSVPVSNCSACKRC